MADMKRRRARLIRKIPVDSVHEGTASYAVPEKEIIIIDQSGRLVLPKKIRNSFETDRFEVRKSGDTIQLIPVKPLHSLFGILPEIDMEKIYREHNREVEMEDAD
jgi:bifunctional DNA-binding transcriptional regulator/antitoxin component of YhaV-PrlF toxin-antitoxin module